MGSSYNFYWPALSHIGEQAVLNQEVYAQGSVDPEACYRDWETDRKSTRLNSSHITRSRMPSSA